MGFNLGFKGLIVQIGDFPYLKSPSERLKCAYAQNKQ